MEIVEQILWIIQIISSSGLVVLVIMQCGKGADAGATFGAASTSNSLFGAAGSANFLSRTTAIFATVFFVVTLLLGVINAHNTHGMGVMADEVIVSHKSKMPK